MGKVFGSEQFQVPWSPDTKGVDFVDTYMTDGAGNVITSTRVVLKNPPPSVGGEMKKIMESVQDDNGTTRLVPYELVHPQENK